MYESSVGSHICEQRFSNFVHKSISCCKRGEITRLQYSLILSLFNSYFRLRIEQMYRSISFHCNNNYTNHQMVFHIIRRGNTLPAWFLQLIQPYTLHSNFCKNRSQFHFVHRGNQTQLSPLEHPIYIVRCVILMCSKFPMKRNKRRSAHAVPLAVEILCNYFLSLHGLHQLCNTAEVSHQLFLIENRFF